VDYTRAAGISDDHVLEWPAFVANAQNTCNSIYTDKSGTWYFMTGYVVEPAAKLSTVPVTSQIGVELDYERHDGETTAETNALIYESGQNVHGKGYTLGMYNNPLNGPLQPDNRIDSTNLAYLIAHVDEFGVFPYPSYQGMTYLQSFQAQMAMLTNPPCAKLNLEVDMAMTVADARALRGAIVSPTCTFGGAELFLDGQVAGGDCSTPYNQVLGTILGLIE
jgi:hypothetical protein